MTIARDSLMSLEAYSKIRKSSKPGAEAYLKLHTFWYMLHGLISISMMNNNESKLELNQLVIRDFIVGFISGINA